jgi:peptidoglycan/LPS O-acetylase OafA/YrhL
MRGQGFRNDINALRAWAVLAVVLFYIEIRGLSGGFAGVDMFFVISGFMMTPIIVKLAESSGIGSGQIAKFYTARAVRIIPALMALVVFAMCVRWFALSASDYRGLGIHAASRLAFVFNMV